MNVNNISLPDSPIMVRSFNLEPYANHPLSYFQFKNKIDLENMYQKTMDEYIAEYLLYLNSLSNKGN